MSPVIIVVVVVLLLVIGILIIRTRAIPSGTAPSQELDAQRFARLLIAEIKLYNRSQIEEGRRSKDLYRRLQKEVDRARRMYDERVGKSVAERADYFHDELVREIAGGDASALGVDYQRS